MYTEPFRVSNIYPYVQIGGIAYYRLKRGKLNTMWSKLNKSGITKTNAKMKNKNSKLKKQGNRDVLRIYMLFFIHSRGYR